MPLNFDVSQVKDYKTLCTDPHDSKKWHPVTNCLIHKTMAVDLGDINERNVDEWWYRVRLLQLLDGPDFEFNDGQKFCLTYRDIKAHVGLRTNVTTKARTYWLKRLFNPSNRLRSLTQEKTAHELFAEKAAELAREL